MASVAWAEGANVGDVCTVAGSLQTKNDAAGAYALVCDGANWQLSVAHEKSGKIGIGDTTPDHVLDVAGNIGLNASSYLNFGDTDGTTGYGLRDNAGTLECKNSGGAWAACQDGSGSIAIDTLTDAVTDYATDHNMRLGSNTAMFAGAAGNLFIGESAGTAGTSNAADNNVAIGHLALDALTTGDANTAVGMGTLSALTAGRRNTTLGQAAMLLTTGGGNNTSVGTESMYYTNSTDNVAMGYRALFGANPASTGTGGRNVALGGSALNVNKDGSDSVAVGYSALALLTTGGTQNIGVGYQAGDNLTTGDKNIIIGYDVDAASATADQQLNIGNAIYGTGIHGGTVKIGVGDASPDHVLDVAGSIGLDASSYINFGDTDGTTGYGLRDNAGTLECKNSGGAWAACAGGAASNVPLSGLTAAAAANSIDSLNYAQTWIWSTLAGTGLKLSAASTAAASDSQKLLEITLSGANGTATQTTYGATIANTHTGASGTNVGLSVSASGGTNNYGLLVPSGSVGIGGTTPPAKFVVTPPATETIAATGTLTADACGTVKQINSSGSVTTNTTNTFTSPTSSYAGCCMDIINVDTADTITLDSNTKFLTASGTNVALAPNQSVRVCSNGTNWYQPQDMASNACPDTTADAFSFTDNANATASTLTSSNIVQVTGLGCSVNTNISGTAGSPEYRICSDSSCSGVVQGWTTGSSSLTSGEYVQLRLTSSGTGGQTYLATFTAGSSATVWSVATAGGDCSGTPAVGTFCADGTVYAGLSPDGNSKMYTTHCDNGQTWNGSACTGVRILLTWNNGSTPSIATGISNTTTGAANTAALVALSNGESPYSAAATCDSLSAHGHTDWYLPAINELSVVYNGQSPIGNFAAGAVDYWTSYELSASQARGIRFSSGAGVSVGKTTPTYMRCVRKDGAPPPQAGNDREILWNNNGQTGSDDNFVFSATGKVGIGDASPDHLLDVAGNIGLNASSYLNFGDTDGTTGYGLRDNAGTLECKNSGGAWAACAGGGSPAGSTTQVQFNDAGAFAGDADFVWDKTGNALTVTGDINFSGQLVDTSDRRMKDNIRPLEGGQLAKILALQGVAFTMKGHDETELGLIAQDVEPLYPDLVKTTANGTKTLNYIGLIGPLIEAVKEQQREIEELRAENRALAERLGVPARRPRASSAPFNE